MYGVLKRGGEEEKKEEINSCQFPHEFSLIRRTFEKFKKLGLRGEKDRF